jgi:ABC-type iron transport system FetAB ATPase subunit
VEEGSLWILSQDELEDLSAADRNGFTEVNYVVWDWPMEDGLAVSWIWHDNDVSQVAGDVIAVCVSEVMTEDQGTPLEEGWYLEGYLGDKNCSEQ